MAHETIVGTYRQTNLPNESPEYLSKREELRLAEIDLMNQREKVATLRRQLPPGAILKDYEFVEGPASLEEGDAAASKVRLSELFTAPNRALSSGGANYVYRVRGDPGHHFHGTRVRCAVRNGRSRTHTRMTAALARLDASLAPVAARGVRQNWVLTPLQDAVFVIGAPLISLVLAVLAFKRYGAAEATSLIIVTHIVLKSS